MGCTASKLDHEDAVRRCKDRSRLIRDAVFSRHHLSSAHSDYCRSLRLVGAALSSFASGEPLSVSDQTPPVLLHPRASPRRPPPPPSSSSSTHRRPPAPPSSSSSSSSSTLPHPPPSSTLPRPPPTRSRYSRIRVPHILSDSSPSASPASTHISTNSRFPHPYYAYPTTPSQASSVWNWENLQPPPSPPPSEFYYHPHDSSDIPDPSDKELAVYDHRGIHRPPAEGAEWGTREREEVRCSEWGDGYGSSASSESEEVEGDDGDVMSGFGSSSFRNQAAGKGEMPFSGNFEMSGGLDSCGNREGLKGRIVVRHRNLKEIVDAVNEYFERAAAAGEQLSEMLETGKSQLDRSFSQLKKTLYHSNNVFSNLSSSWTSKPPLEVKYQMDTSSLVQTGGPKSLCSTLDRLLAWEKKLYDEVKARESAKIELDKKLGTLQSLEYKGGDNSKMDKTKASIKRLQSIIVVTSQSVSTTSTAITTLKDTDLIPQLIDLSHGMKYMWKAMNEYHDVQSCIVEQVRGLTNQPLRLKGEATTNLHRQATRDLESAVSVWHSNFCHLIKYHRDFLTSLHGWLKLLLIRPAADHETSHSGGGDPPSSSLFSFCEEWKLALDRVPDTFAAEAIKSFVNVVHVICTKQMEELKIKRKAESLSKEVEKKASGVRTLERKFYGSSYSTVGAGAGGGGEHGRGLDAHDPLAEKRMEVAASRGRMEEEMVKHGKAVEVTRAMTLNNIQTGLPVVFQALTNFSSLFAEAMDAVCNHSYQIR